MCNRGRPAACVSTSRRMACMRRGGPKGHRLRDIQRGLQRHMCAIVVCGPRVRLRASLPPAMASRRTREGRASVRDGRVDGLGFRDPACTSAAPPWVSSAPTPACSSGAPQGPKCRISRAKKAWRPTITAAGLPTIEVRVNPVRPRRWPRGPLVACPTAPATQSRGSESKNMRLNDDNGLIYWPTRAMRQA